MKRVRTLIGALLSALALIVIGGLVSSPAHAAATVDPVDIELTITRPGGQPADELLQFKPFELHIGFGLPDDVAPGDQFTIEFPPEIEAYTPAPDFQILSPTDDVIGTCSITKSAVTCTLSEWVAGRDDFKDFEIFIGMYAEEATTESTLPITINGDTVIDVDLPDGGIRPVSPTPFPDEPEKNGWVNRDNPGQIVWRIWLDVRGQESLTIEDTFGDGLTLVGDPNARYWTVSRDQWNAGDPFAPGPTGPTSLPGTFTPKAGGSGFDFSATLPSDATVVAITYVTQLPPGVEFGDVVHNSVDGSLGSFTGEVKYTYRADASGNGNKLPDLRIEKQTIGNAEVDAKFTVSVACDKDGSPLVGSPYTRIISVKEPAIILDLPIGAHCIVTETDNGGATEVKYSPAGGEVTLDGGETLVTVIVNNDFTVPTTPPTTTPPTTPPATAESGTPPPGPGTPESGEADGLAETGASVTTALIAALLMLFGAVVVVTRRRSHVR